MRTFTNQVWFIIEGVVTADNEGNTGIGNGWGQPIHIATHYKMLDSLAEHGHRIVATTNKRDTGWAINALHKTTEHGHSALPRPKPVGAWGKPNSKEWAAHLLEGFPQIGPGVAAAIVKHFGGAPLQWTCTPKELCAVPGIGKVRAAALLNGLDKSQHNKEQ